MPERLWTLSLLAVHPAIRHLQAKSKATTGIEPV